MRETEPSALAATQRLLWRLVREPSGVERALRDAGDAEGRALAAVLRADRGLAPQARLGVYAHAYFQRIHDCLAKDFGALAASLGAPAFHDLVKLYLHVHPSRHFSLRDAGRALPGFLAQGPAAAFFRERWAFAADLAALEWALTEVFDARDAPVLGRSALAARSPDQWPELRFATSPALILLRLDWPVHVLRERFDAGLEEAPPTLAPDPTPLRVWRHEERVFHRLVTPLELELLEALREGAPFGALCERIERELGEEQTPLRAAAWLERWLADGILSAVL